MSTVNRKSTGSTKHRRKKAAHTAHRAAEAHKNWMGGPSYKVGDPIWNLKIAAASCFFGEPMYYHDSGAPKRRPATGLDRPGLSGIQLTNLRKRLNAVDPQTWRSLTPQKMMEKAIDDALDYDAEATLQVAAELRTQDHIRTTPQVIMVRAANHPRVKGTGLIRKYASQIIQRPDELPVQLAYQLGTYGRPIPNSLKGSGRAWARALVQFKDYQLAKYRMEGREVTLADVINLTTGGDCKRLRGLVLSTSVNRLLKGELKTTGQTWEAIISEGGSWNDAFNKMGHMACLRNVRNLLEKGKISPTKISTRLKDGAKDGKQLPFRYLSAYQANKGASPVILDAIEECLELSVGNLPRFDGRVMSLCDNSGSAWGTMTSSMGTMHVAEIGNLTGVLTGKAADEGYIGVFGDRLSTLPIRKKDSIFSQAESANRAGKGIGHDTEHGVWLFWDQAIRKKEHWDHVFVYSDMQAGHGGMYGVRSAGYPIWGSDRTSFHAYIDVPELIMQYREKVNPNVMVYLVQTAGYQDTLIPEFYDRTYIMGGWGQGILQFASKMSELVQ